MKGAVKVEADANNWETFVVPDNVGGRFSVLTAVGLLPIAASGADITALMEGANAARKDLSSDKISENIAYQYAAVRNVLYRKGYITEILANYEPSLQYFGEWWKQLAGESEGKDQKGFTQLQLTSQQTFTHLVNLSKKVTVTSLKQLFVLINLVKMLSFLN